MGFRLIFAIIIVVSFLSFVIVIFNAFTFASAACLITTFVFSTIFSTGFY